MKSENYTVPKDIMEAIVIMINDMPYGKIAPLAQAVAGLIQQQDNQVDETTRVI